MWHIKRHGGGDECPKHKDEPIENDLLKALEDKQMSNYQFGVYANWNWKSPALGIGFNNFGEEKYLHISLLFLDVAIGKTGR